MLISAQVAVI